MADFFNPGADHLSLGSGFGAELGNIDAFSPGESQCRFGRLAICVVRRLDVGTQVSFYDIFLSAVDTGKRNHEAPGGSEGAAFAATDPVLLKECGQLLLEMVQGEAHKPRGNFLGTDF